MRKTLLAATAVSVACTVFGAAASGRPARTASVFFYERGALTRVSFAVAPTGPLASAALEALLAGPPRGYTTAIPQGVRLLSVRLLGNSVAGSLGSATFSRALGTPSRSAQAQIVATLTRATGAARITIAVQGTGPVALERGDGRAIVGGARTADYADLTASAPIFVGSPVRGATVSSPVGVSGTADTFEATFQLEIRAGGRVVATKTITASSGTGTRGTWSASLTLPHGDVTLVFYEVSAKDGSHIHVTQMPLHVR